MKHIIIVLLLLCTVVSSMGQVKSPQYFYYYKGEKKALELNTDYVYVVTNTSISDASKLTLSLGLGSETEIVKFGQDNAAQTLNTDANAVRSREAEYWAEVKLSSDRSSTNYRSLLNTLKKNTTIKMVAPYFKNKAEDKIGLSQFFYVKLKSEFDLDVLQEMAKATNTQIVGQNKFMPQWFTLKCIEKSSINALEAANQFYESGKFLAAEPDLMGDNDTQNSNDPLLGDQWGLNNTGQNGGTAGTDVEAFDAWNITTGNSNVIVAVLDHGFEMDHPDLDDNTFGTGFDTESGTTPAQVLGSHGTACAGIVAAEQDNNDGISGVAPTASLMSISNSLGGNPNSRQRRADGINWAWQNGAAVISNSWSSGVQYQIIDDAIEAAIDNGRGGLGTVIVFATGNGNGAVSYPANSNPDILAVGAMSPCGERKNPNSCDGENWGSDSGAELDVVAPGVLIATTDRQGSAGYNSSGSGNFSDTNYTNRFNGTSSACPMVAGIAALVISANSSLTALEVNSIIEESAQKVGGYAYANTAGRPNGTWHTEMGYGLVSAHDAVVLAGAGNCPTTLTVTQNVPNGTTDNRGASNSITATNTIFTGGTATYHAGSSVVLKPGFQAQAGSGFHAYIQGCTGNAAQDVAYTVTENEQEVLNLDEASLEQANEEGAVLWPNPTPGKFNLKLGGDLDANNEVIILDRLGYQLASFKDLTPGKPFSIDFLKNKGIYLVKIVAKEKVIWKRIEIKK